MLWRTDSRGPTIQSRPARSWCHLRLTSWLGWSGSLRKAAGMTTMEIADAAGVSNANISHWETGGRLIPPDRLTTILDALGVTDEDQRERLLGLRRRAEGPARTLTDR